jgi:ribose transport system substrate-binding protein
MSPKSGFLGITLIVAALLATSAVSTVSSTYAAAPMSAATSAATAAATGAATQNCPNPHGQNGKCRVVLVNSFLGNDYRVFMQQLGVKASHHPPFSDEWQELEILNTENTAEAQNAGMENLLAQGVDAILLDSVSDTSASDVVKKACEQGVTVVTFDVTDKAGAPCEYRIDFDFKGYNTNQGKWVGKKLNCQGNVVLDKGLQGVSIAQDMYDGWLAGLKEVCGDKIKVVQTFYGQFGPGPLAQALPGILASNPQIDAFLAFLVDTTPAVVAKAFTDAGRPVPILASGYSNADALACIQEKWVCHFTSTSWGPAVAAMETAYKVFHGQDVPKQQSWGITYYTTDPSIDIGVPQEELKLGKNAFTDKPAGYTPSYNWPGATLQIPEDEAYGK